MIFEVLEDLHDTQDGRRLNEADQALLIKALLVHGASWRNTSKIIWDCLGTAERDDVARLLGYGKTQPERVLSCTDQRATIIGYGSLEDGKAHLYTIPLPPSLSGISGLRRVTVTLAWFTPTNSSHSNYRRASLWFDPYEDKIAGRDFESILRIGRQECDWRTARRGTIQHEVFEGASAIAFASNENLKLQVNCRECIEGLEESIPYALAVTIEVAENINIPLYEEIRCRIQPVVEVAAAPRS